MVRTAAVASSQPCVDLSHHLRLPHAPPYANLNFHRWEPGRAMDWHGHDFLQAIQVLDGTLEVDWGPGWRRLGPGTVHVLPARARHRLRSAGHVQFGLNFSPDDDDRGLLGLLRSACRVPLAIPCPAPPGCLEALRSIEAVDAPADRLAAAAELDRWCLALAAGLQGREPGGSRLLAALRTRLDRPLRVPALARELGLSRVAVQRLAHRAHGTGVAHLHERLRLERAAHLLATTALTCAAVATRCGFREGAHLARRFRARYGAAPSVWRNGLG
jgi:AraC-like DNA-binding protein/quercetin dioxygenase-like cupin family protein